MNLKYINHVVIVAFLLTYLPITGQNLPQEIRNDISVLNDKQKVEYLSKRCWSNREKDTDSALIYGKYAIKLADSLALYNQLAKVNNFIGVIYLHYIHDIHSSISYFHNALATALQVRDTLQIAYAYNNLGDAFYLTGNIQLALEYGENSRYYFNELNNVQGIAYSYINLGLANRADKKYDKSIEYFKEAVKLRKNIDDNVGIASGIYEIAQSYFEKSDYKQAKLYYDESLDLHKELDNKMYIALCLNGLGDICFAEENYENALKKYNKALKCNKEGNRRTGMIQNHLGRALVFSKIGKKNAGEAALTMALDLAKEIGYPSNILEAYKTRAEFYANVGDYKLANKNYLKYVTIYDSLFTVEQQETLAEMQHNFLITQNLYELNNDLEIKKKETFILVFTIIIFITLGLALVWKYMSNLKLNRRLKSINDSKDKLFSIVSHDLKSPFNSILGFSELLVKSVKEDKLENTGKYANYINLLSKQTVNLITNLTSWSTSQRGILKIHEERFNLYNLVKEIYDIHIVSAQKKNIIVTIDMDKQSSIYADKKILRIVFTNLLTNAIKFTPPLGEVIISAQKKIKYIEIKFKDSGVGINESDISKLFDIKNNYTTAGTDDEKGTGLGLIICKEFIELHKGKIDLESKVGKGTTFTIILPQ